MGHYIATDRDHTAIHGLGETPEQAIADAQAASGDSRCADWLVTYPCTSTLAAQIVAEGGLLRWRYIDGVADVIAE